MDCRYSSVIRLLSSRDVSADLRHRRPVRPSAADYPAGPAAAPRAVEGGRGRQATLVLALIAAVIVLDQAVKWWAWRHVPWARINAGGDMLTGRTIGAWYGAPVTGALLDLVDFSVLSVAVSALARSRVPAFVSGPGALVAGGWGSNLLDRLGVHYWTAPGSVRGAVDFIHIGGHYYNVADFFIIGATPAFVLAAGYYGARAVARRGQARTAPRPARPRSRVRIPVLAGLLLTMVVALGAANYGGVAAASCLSARHDGGTAVHGAAVSRSAC